MAKLTDYTPLAHNPNKGSKRGSDLLKTSLEQGGIGRSIVVDNNGDILGGNHVTEGIGDIFGIDTPVLEVPTDGNTLVVVKRTDIPSAKSAKGKHLILADNRVGDFHEYDLEVLKEFEPEVLSEYFFDEELVELGNEELDTLPEADSNYTRKITPPTYEPSNEKPAIPQLFDDSKTQALIKAIEASPLSEAEKQFLILAAYRHTVFNFDKIADWYAHSPAPTQRLMEDSALVIIDFNRAIELGFVKLTERLMELFEGDYPHE